MNIIIPKLIVFVCILVLLVIWVQIDNVIAKRELKDLEYELLKTRKKED